MTTAEAPRAEVRLDLEGMTCASCVSRIERKLNKLDGVEASVNFATEQATVRYDASVAVDDLVSAVEAAGYHARPALDAGVHQHHDEPIAVLRRRLAVAVALTVPLALIAMVPALQFTGWEWVALVLATPVVFWSGSGFHRAALQSARHLAATMDTLISMGTLAAWLVVGGGPDRWARRRHVLRGRGRDHDADPARPLPGGPREEQLVASDPDAARARREGGGDPA